MIVLGLNWTNDARCIHETGASLVKDGRIVAATNEDRITRVKHDGPQPIKSLFEVLKISSKLGISPGQVDAVAIPISGTFENYSRGIYEAKGTGKIKALFRMPVLLQRKGLLQATLRSFGIDAPIYYVNHHQSHAASAYYPSGFDSATVITIDGIGERKTSTVSLAEQGRWQEFGASYDNDSAGFFYAKATEAIGFHPNDGEGKTTGLACYGNASKCIGSVRKFLTVEGLSFKGNYGVNASISRLNLEDPKPYVDYRHGSFAENAFVPLVKSHGRQHVAAAVQAVLEERACELVANAVKATGNPKVCLSGGVALNVKMNKAIRELDCVEDIFIFPNPSDSGSDAGAALQVYWQLCNKEFRPWKMMHPYFGASYSNQEAEAAISDFGLRYEKLGNASSCAADLVAEGKVLGWFQGSLEYGPRALGNRSVLADPTKPEMRDRINFFLKKRDWFMPFAPSMLNSAIPEYLERGTESPFMIMAFNATKKAANEAPAVVHVDGTTRPQTVTKQQNQGYWKLIKEFEKNKGIPAVLNTSFNKHGLVMIRSPLEALNHLAWGCVEELIINDYRVYREFTQKKFTGPMKKVI